MRNGAKHSPFTNFLQRNAMKAENANSEDTNSMPNPETFSRNRLVDTSIQRTVWQGSPKDSKTPVQDALKQQDVKGLSPLRQNTTLSAPWQRFVEHAHEMMFGKESSRAFSSDMLSEIKFPKEGEPSSISADQWQPKSVADLHPLKELAEALDEQNIEIWKERAEKSLGGEVAIEIIDKECRKLRNKLAHLASDYLANAKLCRRVKPDELHKILVEEGFGSTWEGKSLSWQRRTAKVQNALFGYPLEISPILRPIHVIATHDLYGDNNDCLDYFGDISIYFKKRFY